MLTTKTLATAIVAVTTVSINAHAAPGQNNPLHPDYYAQRVTMDFNVKATARYVDAANPLHPTFAKTSLPNDWVATGTGNGKGYVDSANPLHPMFKR